MLSSYCGRLWLFSLLLAAPAAGQGLPPIQPDSAGLDQPVLERLDSAMNGLVQTGKLPGLVMAVARHGRLAHMKAFGMRSVEQRDRMEPDDLFRIYSMTKPIASAAMMVLVEAGRVGLDDPVSRYLPAFADVKVWTSDGPAPPRRPMTIRDLLQHTSGLTYGAFGETPVDSAYRKADLLQPRFTLQQLTDQLARLPLVGHPGEVWNYGFSTDVVGRIIEIVSGQPLDQFIAQRILQPLGMKDTFFEVPPAKRNRLTGYYAHNGATLALVDSPDSGSYTRPPLMFSGGGGLVSTVPDYLRFAQMILNGGELDGVRVLRRETVAQMLSNQLPPALVPIAVVAPIEGTGFGLGFSVVVAPRPGHPSDVGRAGWGGYANTFFWIDPPRRLIAMVFTQYFPFGAHNLEEEFRRLVYQAVR